MLLLKLNYNKGCLTKSRFEDVVDETKLLLSDVVGDITVVLSAYVLINVDNAVVVSYHDRKLII